MWYHHITDRNAREAFWPGEHKSYAQLEEERDLDLSSSPTKLPFFALRTKSGSQNYTCITDAGRLGNGPNSYNFAITTLRHLTTEGPAKQILAEGGFRGGEKEISLILPDQMYSWWSVHYDEKNSIRYDVFNRADDIESELKLDAYWSDSPEIEVSYPFLDRGVYDGKHAFTYDIHDMLRAYGGQFCQDSYPVMRVLGTFVYRQQIMHAVLVHSSLYNCLFRHLPLVSDQRVGNRIYRSSSGQLFWCPESIIRRQDYPYSPWERLCFAFHLPEHDSILKLDDPPGHHNYVECDLLGH